MGLLPPHGCNCTMTSSVNLSVTILSAPSVPRAGLPAQLIAIGIAPMNNLIPQVLHQTWKTRELPAQLDLYRESWKRCHPNWQFPLYDDDGCRAFVRAHFPDFL